MKAKLPADLSKDFELVGSHHDRVVTSWGEITFSKLTRKHADSLISRGYLGLRKKIASIKSAAAKATESVPVEPKAEEVGSDAAKSVKSPSKKATAASERE